MKRFFLFFILLILFFQTSEGQDFYTFEYVDQGDSTETVVDFLNKNLKSGKHFLVREINEVDTLSLYVQHYLPTKIEIDTTEAKKADLVAWCHSAAGPNFDKHLFPNTWEVVSFYEFRDDGEFMVWEGKEHWPDRVMKDIKERAANYMSANSPKYKDIIKVKRRKN